MEKRGIVFVFCLILFLIILFQFVNSATSSEGSISLEVIQLPGIMIHSPVNGGTYNFGVTEERLILINVSTLGGYEPDYWWYNLRDSDGNLESNEFFNNLDNLTAIEGMNYFEVYGNDSDGLVKGRNISFEVIVSVEPILGDFNDTLYICENTKFYYEFNATGLDGDDLTASINKPSPPDPFRIIFPQTISGDGINPTYAYYNLTTQGNLTKTYVKEYSNPYDLEIYVTADTSGLTGGPAESSIHAIEINNAPDPLIGARTLWLQGENSSLIENVSVNDIEENLRAEVNLSFNLSWANGEDFFNISENGFWNFTPNSSHLGIYNLTLCVEDGGTLYDEHPNISLCAPYTADSLSVCENFSLTITNDNRAPIITNYRPNDTTLVAIEGETLRFNVSAYDPDGNIPSIRWYFDDVLVKDDSMASDSAYSKTLGYTTAGNHTLVAYADDGLLNDSIQWNITVSNAEPPVSGEDETGGGGGGGGAGRAPCTPEWVCDYWNNCEHIRFFLDSANITQLLYNSYVAQCSLEDFNEAICGIQRRVCVDINKCGTDRDKPNTTQVCHYTSDPNCNDGIKNCHGGLCEISIDCGGPCGPCPTCSDGLKNQGESGIDCGGPCPWKCEIEIPLVVENKTKLVMIIGIAILLTLIILVIRIYRIRRKLKLQKILKKANI